MNNSELFEQLMSNWAVRTSLYDKCRLANIFYPSSKTYHRLRGMTNDNSHWINCWSEILMLAKEALDDTAR